ncbi:MAG: DUF819 family protein [Victivallales bacterium]|nr:DUF819 family protein [Victivallales bacterium]MCF7889572.1 DUF819 family protein [Victivallales bacterium]
MESALVSDSFGIIAVLIAVPAVIYTMANSKTFGKLFTIIPSLVFAYFIPTVLSACNVIPVDAPIYTAIKRYLLPASLLLLTISVDIKGIFGLGYKALVMFFAATAGVVIGGPISLIIFKNALPADVWTGMSALAGSWIGGGANFIAIGNAVGATSTMLGMMVIVDVLSSNIWRGCIFFLAGKARTVDRLFKADTNSIDELVEKTVEFQESTRRIPTTVDYMVMIGGTFIITWLALKAGKALPEIGSIISHGTWGLIIITSLGVLFSFTKIKNYDGAGASKLGSVLLYMLIGVIGAGANVKEVVHYPLLFAMGITWITVHVIVMIVTMKLIKAPLFFMAVGSQANVGGAASAPIVASAFHPALASVGVMLGIAGYVMGTYAALLCAWLLKLVS